MRAIARHNEEERKHQHYQAQKSADVNGRALARSLVWLSDPKEIDENLSYELE